MGYPKTSKWAIENPSSKQWNKLYESCTELLVKEFIRHVIRCTYSGFYVDEYQDCSELQHSLVCGLAEILPCRILGDPLQAIFDFADKPVDWENSIYPHFTNLGKLQIPWRWYQEGANKLLGDWLKEARDALDSGKNINLNNTLPKGVSKVFCDVKYLPAKQYNTLNFFNKTGTVIALFGGDPKSKNNTHNLASKLSGKFSSIEEVEGKALFTFLQKWQSEKSDQKRFILVLEFAKKCFIGINDVLVAGTKRGEKAKPIKTTKPSSIPILEAANNYFEQLTSKNLRNFFHLIKEHPDIQISRRDLLNRFLNILKLHIDEGEASTLLESAHIYQREFRHSGRPLRHTKLIGTTLLVKGLEYDHAIILDADSLDLKALYVAMTRGSKSLTIITTNGLLPY